MRIQPTPPNMVLGGFIRDGARWMPMDKKCSMILDVDLYVYLDCELMSMPPIPVDYHHVPRHTHTRYRFLSHIPAYCILPWYPCKFYITYIPIKHNTAVRSIKVINQFRASSETFGSSPGVRGVASSPWKKTWFNIFEPSWHRDRQYVNIKVHYNNVSL